MKLKSRCREVLKSKISVAPEYCGGGSLVKAFRDPSVLSYCLVLQSLAVAESENFVCPVPVDVGVINCLSNVFSTLIGRNWEYQFRFSWGVCQKLRINFELPNNFLVTGLIIQALGKGN
jgi:hypothetical protein